MIVDDRVYGKIDIQEKVIEDIILSAPMQRLQKISQDGAAHFIQSIRNVNRLEHCIGVWYLSKLYDRPIEEQVACLLHDVPHTAFSHVIDFVVEDEKHEFHERFTEKIITESEIPQILDSHDISLEEVLDVHKFPLLENSLPDISFDRLDYFLRDGTSMGYVPKSFVTDLLNDLKLKDSMLYLSDVGLASLFAILFVNFSRLIWLDPNSHGAFFLISEAIKRAMVLGKITEDDFFTDDEVLMDKLRKIKDPVIDGYLNRLIPGKEFVYAEKENADFYGPNKPRFVNPLVEVGSELKRLTNVVPNLAYYFQEYSKNYKYLGVKQL